MKYGNNEHCLKCKSPNDKYKTGAEQTRTYTKISILCRPGQTRPAVYFLSLSEKRENS